jgi:hypothetical protein
VAIFPARLRTYRRLRARKRLARAVRRHARAEHDRRLAAGGIADEALEARADLYEALATRLEALAEPADPHATERLSRLVAERRPLFDFGPYARARDAELESILIDLASQEGGHE